jgi:paraquat-inducible protein B
VANVNGKVDPLAENLNRTITDARGLVNNVDQQVKPLAGKATSALDDISKLVRDVDAKVDPLSKQLGDTLKSVESAFKSIDGLVGKASPTRAELDSTLQELSGAARSLRILADYLEQHPESLIKGKGY